MLQLAVIAPI